MALCALPEDFYNYAQQIIFLNYFSDITEILSRWEFEYAMHNYNLTEAQRRQRIKALRQMTGGQSIYYLQKVLRDFGFDVYCYKAFVRTGTGYTVINPFDYLRTTYLPGGGTYTVECGEPLAQCGEPLAQCGEKDYRSYYPLVNKIPIEVWDGGEVTYTYVDYTLPVDENKWRFFIYIAGSVFPNPAKVDIARQNEFEEVIMRIFPAFSWRGIIVDFI